MKKIQIFLFAAISILAVASCTRDELVDTSIARPKGEPTVLTLSLDKTRTSLVNGKTTWLAGDKIRIYSSTGKFYEDVAVPAADDNKTSVEIEVNMSDTLFYAVYPVESANGITGGNVSFKIPTNPDGRFASANISAAKSKGNTLEMRNLAAVLKIKVASNNVVEILQLNAKNPMNGTFTANLDGENPVVEASSPAKSATVAVGAVDGDYYIPVAAGTYDEEFSVTALKGNGGYQTLTTSRKNEVAINSLLDMGTIGDNLSSGLSGEGTESSPYIISNLGEYGAFASSVNLGSTYEGKFVSLTENVEDVQTTIGYYVDADVKFPFSGTFLGNGKTVTLNLDGAATKTPNYVAMFGYVGPGAIIKDVNVAGTVSTTGNYAAGLAAYLYGSLENKITVDNCSSSADVTAAAAISGIAGYATQSDISNCKNSGKLVGDYNIGGIIGYSYVCEVANCSNNGEIESKKDCGRVMFMPSNTRSMTYLDGSSSVGYGTISTLGVGGIAGWAQNTNIASSRNNAVIKGVSKLGGIAGALYWGTTKNCVNTGNITGSQDFIGGIVGWTYTSSTNDGDSNSGAISGRAAVGGIAGMTNGGISNATLTVKNCTNAGNVTAGKTSFNVVFYNYGFANFSAAGGIVGFACDHQNGANQLRCAQLSNNVNNGKVLGEGQAVGGIIGMHACPLNSNVNPFVENCVNNGEIETKLYRAGGIVGVSFDRFTSARFVIRNNANHGKIVGPYVLAGIVAWASSAYPTGSENSKNYGEQIVNNYNDGEIVYDPTAYDQGKGPYVGGIVGYCQQSWIANDVNYGTISVKAGTTANDYDKDFLAEVVPFLGKSSVLDNFYAKKTANAIVPPTLGSPEPTMGEVYGVFGDNGEFDVAVVIGENTFEKPVDALNSWVGSSTLYLKWKEGSNKFPVFAE